MDLKPFIPEIQIVFSLGNVKNPVPYSVLKKYFVDEAKNFTEKILKTSLETLEIEGCISQKPCDIKLGGEEHVTEGYVLEERARVISKMDAFSDELPKIFPDFYY